MRVLPTVEEHCHEVTEAGKTITKQYTAHDGGHGGIFEQLGNSSHMAHFLSLVKGQGQIRVNTPYVKCARQMPMNKFICKLLIPWSKAKLD